MNNIVTGGAGFIGSNLCEALLDRGENVLCLDNLVCGSLENINHLLSNKNFKLALYSVDMLDEILDRNEKYDRIYHLASPTAPVDINNNKELTRRVNSIGTCRLLILAEKMGAKFLFVSSVKVHGDCPRVSDYIYGKRLGEQLCLNSKAKIARLANVYGPGMSIIDSRVVPTFITKMLKNQEISLWNGGKQIDSFCYVEDIVRGLISFMDSDIYDTIEFGYPEGISIKMLSQQISKLINNYVKIKTDEEVVVVDECHKVVDIEKAKKLLNWEPKITLEYGLERTILYFREKLNLNLKNPPL